MTGHSSPAQARQGRVRLYDLRKILVSGRDRSQAMAEVPAPREYLDGAVAGIACALAPHFPNP